MGCLGNEDSFEKKDNYVITTSVIITNFVSPMQLYAMAPKKPWSEYDANRSHLVPANAVTTQHAYAARFEANMVNLFPLPSEIHPPKPKPSALPRANNVAAIDKSFSKILKI